MKYMTEYRSPKLVEKIISDLKRNTTGHWNIMEVCGGQTHAIFKFGIDQIIPRSIELIHGPGCPVCVTPAYLIDQAISIAFKKDTILCTFGDMMRVPGSDGNFLSARAKGAKIQIVYSPLEALTLAQKNPSKRVVFLAIGFETTAPLNGHSVKLARQIGVNNYSIINGMLRIPPAIDALLSDSDSRIDALLAPGHVCTITGTNEYEELANKYKIPIIATGFEPTDLLEGIYHAVMQLEKGTARLDNQYSRAVEKDGNQEARRLIDEVFDITDGTWRGLGSIKDSGFTLNNKYREFDAIGELDNDYKIGDDSGDCIITDILRGFAKPNQCPEFGRRCQPEHPLGPMMVSSEGVCSAYYRYRSDHEKEE